MASLLSAVVSQASSLRAIRTGIRQIGCVYRVVTDLALQKFWLAFAQARDHEAGK